MILILSTWAGAACVPPLGDGALADRLGAAVAEAVPDPAGWAALGEALTCLSEPISPQTAARYHLVAGLVALDRGDPSAAEALLAALRLDEDTSWAGVLEQDRALRVALAGVRREPVADDLLPRPREGALRVDGHEGRARGRGLPAVVQRVAADGAVLETAWLPAGAAPTYEARPEPRWGLELGLGADLLAPDRVGIAQVRGAVGGVEGRLLAQEMGNAGRALVSLGAYGRVSGALSLGAELAVVDSVQWLFMDYGERSGEDVVSLQSPVTVRRLAPELHLRARLERRLAGGGAGAYAQAGWSARRFSGLGDPAAVDLARFVDEGGCLSPAEEALFRDPANWFIPSARVVTGPSLGAGGWFRLAGPVQLGVDAVAVHHLNARIIRVQGQSVPLYDLTVRPQWKQTSVVTTARLRVVPGR